MNKFLAFATVMSVMALVACDDSTSSNNAEGTSSTIATSSVTGTSSITVSSSSIGSSSIAPSSSQPGVVVSSSSSTPITTGEKHACLSVVNGENESCVYSADSIATDEVCATDAESGSVVTAVVSCPSGATVTCDNIAGLPMSLYLYSQDYIGMGEQMCAMLNMPE